jgi:predicted nucleotidyltransferase
MSLEVIVEGLKRCCYLLEELLNDEFLGLILFGSWARGEGREGSDVDVFIVLKSLGGMEVRSRVYKVISECVNKPITLVDVRVDELFKDEVELTPLLLNILADGVVIYDKTGRLGELKLRLREFIESVGLERYRTPDGRYGWRRRDGKPLIHL